MKLNKQECIVLTPMLENKKGPKSVTSFLLYEIEKRRANETYRKQNKRNTQFREEIKAIDNKKSIEKISKAKNCSLRSV